jgi:hypothetical protein
MPRAPGMRSRTTSTLRRGTISSIGTANRSAGDSACSQCLGIAWAADVAAALPDAKNRRRLRQQDGAARSADRRPAGDEGEAAGQADLFISIHRAAG